VEIRSLEWADIPSVVDLAKQMHAESAFSRFQFDDSKMAVQLTMPLTHPESQFCHVAVKDKEVVGALFGYLTEFLFGPELIAMDYGWYVLPKARGTSARVRLLKNFQRWAKDHGAVEVCMGVSTNVQKDKTGKLFKKLGYKHVGGLYKLGL